MASSTVEDYLKSILQIGEKNDGKVTVGQIAAELGVTPGTVSSMMRHLSEEDLIDYFPRRSVKLRSAGRKQALQVVRKHRILETFLVKIMELDWAEVHEEAEILEHVLSDRLLQRMDEMLAHPSHDPHGDPIPDSEGNVTDQETIRLSEAENNNYRVVRVDDSDPEFLDWLRLNHLMPGSEIDLKGIDPITDIVELAISSGGEIVRLGKAAASNILIEPR